MTNAAGFRLSTEVERIIDGMRYPLANVAKKIPPADAPAWEDMRRGMSNAVNVGVQYHNFESMWLECLWSNHEVLPLQGLNVFRPSDPAQEAQRVVGRTRREALVGEIVAHSFQIWRKGPPPEMLALARRARVSGTERRGKTTALTIGIDESVLPPQAMVLRAAATEFYDEPLLLEPLPAYSGLSASDLLNAWEVWQPLAELLRTRMPDIPRAKTKNQLRQFSPTFEKTELAQAVVTALGFDPSEASAAVAALTFPNDPRSDLWYYPFVEAGRGRVTVLLDVLESPNLLRSIEHWLGSGGLDLDERGPLFETWVRSELGFVCDLPDTQILDRTFELTEEGDYEEIDLFLKIHTTIVVGEVKCTLRPANPIAEHRYAEVLEGAAEQARRKANLIHKHRETVLKQLGWDTVKQSEIRVQPIVLTNLPNGLGRQFDGVPVVDLISFGAFLGKGTVRREVVLTDDGEKGGERTSLVAEGENLDVALERFLRDPPQLDVFYEHLAVSLSRPVSFQEGLDPVCRVTMRVAFPEVMPSPEGLETNPSDVA